MTVALPARAKLNLDLAVTGTRAGGMHELRTRMQAIDLHDLVEAEPADKTALEMSGVALEREATNTVLLAHSALQEAVQRELPTRFRVHKRIPAGSGLGGASSDAAAALRAMAVIFQLDTDLRPVALQVGADVTFFLTGGAARVEGIGERVTFEAVTPGWFAIAWPDIELSTAAVYHAWDEVGGDGVNELQRAAAHVEPAVARFAESLGAGWQMTGSGSAFFRMCPDRESAVVATRGLECWTAVASAMERWA